MPRYIQASTGQQVDPSIATFSDGRTKPGFHAIVEDGEYVGGFAMMFRDSKPAATFGEPGKGMMYADSAQPTHDAQIDQAVNVELARMRMVHHQKFAFMGDRAPAFDASTAVLVARQKVADDGLATSKALAALRHQPTGDRQVADARAKMMADMQTGQFDGAAIASSIRAARYI